MSLLEYFFKHYLPVKGNSSFNIEDLMIKAQKNPEIIQKMERAVLATFLSIT
jgi:hypothetical protein